MNSTTATLAAVAKLSQRRAKLLAQLARLEAQLNQIRRNAGLPEI